MRAPLRKRLRDLDAQAAQARTAALAALAGDGALLLARGEPAAATGWILCETGRAEDAPVAVAPLAVGGAPLSLRAEDGGVDGAAAAAALDSLDGLCSHIERALRVVLHPVGLSASPPAEPPIIVERAGDRLMLATGRLNGLPPPRADLSRLSPQTAAPVRIALDGPSLRPDRLGAIAPGALILLGAPPLTATLSCGGRAWQGAADPAQRLLRILLAQEPRPMSETADLAIPLTCVLDGGALPIAMATSLAPGSVVPLPGGGDSIPVTLHYGGAPLGRGELVALGDGYGVVVTEVARAADAA